jgi:hypothetical protein
MTQGGAGDGRPREGGWRGCSGGGGRGEEMKGQTGGEQWREGGVEEGVVGVGSRR